LDRGPSSRDPFDFGGERGDLAHRRFGRASWSSRRISPEAQPSNGDGCAGITIRSAASNVERISVATRGGPSIST